MQEALKERISQNYEFIRDLGSDWLGEVYEAKRHLGGGRVVIKTLHQKTAQKADLANKIYKSIKNVRAIVHPNLAKIIDVEKKDDNQIVFVREFFKGESLRSLINRKGKLPTEQAVAISIQILSALSAIHKRRFNHGNLNPSNVYVYREKDKKITVKLIDYSMFDVQDLMLEFSDMIKNYMSPEQAIGDSAGDEQTDIFAVGAILYELLSGRRAYETKKDEDVTLQIAMHTPVPLRSISTRIPKNLIKEIERSMESESEKRHRNVVEFIKMLLPFTPNIAETISPSSLIALKRLLPGESTLIEKENKLLRDATELYNSLEKIEIRPSVAPVRPSSQTKLHFQKSGTKKATSKNKRNSSESLYEPVYETKTITITASEPTVFSEKALESLNPPFAKIEEGKKENISDSLKDEIKNETNDNYSLQKIKINKDLENLPEKENITSSGQSTQNEEEKIESDGFIEKTGEDSAILPLAYLEKEETDTIDHEYNKKRIAIKINEYKSLWKTRAKYYLEIVSLLITEKTKTLKPLLTKNREKILTLVKEKKPVVIKLVKNSVATRKRQYIAATGLILLFLLIVVLIIAGSNSEDSKAIAGETNKQAILENKNGKKEKKQESSTTRIEEKAGLKTSSVEKMLNNETDIQENIEDDMDNDETEKIEEKPITNKKIEKKQPKNKRWFRNRNRKFKKPSNDPVNKNWATNPFERH